MRIHIKNQSKVTLDFCCGEIEHTLDPDEEISIEVKDGDCMYLDEVNMSLKPGDKVKMVNCLEAELEKYKDKVWMVRSEPWDLCGTEVVLLEGKAGGFATEFLEKV